MLSQQFILPIADELVVDLFAGGGLVLDPFTGSGTTAAVALTHGRRFVGCELNADYIALANERVASISAAKPKGARRPRRQQEAQRELFEASA